MKKLMPTRILLIAVLASTSNIVLAAELVYRPVNPGFGGFSSNYNYLIGTADIQNQHREEGGGGGGVPVIDFPDIDIDLGGGVPAAPAAETTAPSATTFTVNNN